MIKASTIKPVVAFKKITITRIQYIENHSHKSSQSYHIIKICQIMQKFSDSSKLNVSYAPIPRCATQNAKVNV